MLDTLIQLATWAIYLGAICVIVRIAMLVDEEGLDDDEQE